MENLFTPDCIRTYTGLYMNVFDPTPEMICIEDIAHSLAFQCRFGGHLPEFYSVAQHSVYVCDIVEANPGEDSVRLQALLHDASEAYLLDIPSPIKHKLDDYRKIEQRLMVAIADKFGFPYPLHQSVKDADKDLLRIEWDVLMLRLRTTHEIIPWLSAVAEFEFLKTFNTFKK